MLHISRPLRQEGDHSRWDIIHDDVTPPPLLVTDPFLSMEAAGLRASIAPLLATRPSIPLTMPS